MRMLNIKMLKDNGRTVIIIDGSDRERDEAAFHIVSAYMTEAPAEAVITPATQESEVAGITQKQNASIPPAPEIREIKGLAPVKSTPASMPTEAEIASMEPYAIARQRGRYIISTGTYTGMTPVEALVQGDAAALVELFNVSKQMGESQEKQDIIAACKQYMTMLPERGAELYVTREDKLKFINTAAPIVSIDTFINGYASLDSFTAVANDDDIQNIFSSMLWSLAGRGGRAIV